MSDSTIENERLKLVKVTTMDILKASDDIILSETNSILNSKKSPSANDFHPLSIDYDDDITNNCIVFDNMNNVNNLDNSSDRNNYDSNTNSIRNFFHTLNEKAISIFLHVLIMATFQIYFYFNYVIGMEKQLLLDKINTYLNEFNEFFTEHSTSTIKTIIHLFFADVYNDDIDTYLYNQYLEAKEEQNKLLHSLLLFCYKILIFISSFFVFFSVCGFLHKQKMHWLWIIAENIIMLGLLGTLEYIIFKNVIIKYSPINDAEVKYTIYKEVVNIFNETYVKK